MANKQKAAQIPQIQITSTSGTQKRVSESDNNQQQNNGNGNAESQKSSQPTSAPNDSPRSLGFHNVIAKVKEKKGTLRNAEPHDKLKKNDFCFLAKIGKGGFGRVFLVRHKQSQQGKMAHFVTN